MFQSVNVLFTHALQVQKGKCGETNFQCISCDKFFYKRAYLVAHVKKVHNKPIFQCAECHKLYPTKLTVDKHIASHHIKKTCKYCNKKFKNGNTLRSHVFTCKGKPCDKSTVSRKRDAIKPQAEIATTDTVIISSFEKDCIKCGTVIKTKSGFSHHMKIHAKKYENQV